MNITHVSLLPAMNNDIKSNCYSAHFVACFLIAGILTFTPGFSVNLHADWNNPVTLLTEVEAIRIKHNIPALAIVLMDKNRVISSQVLAKNKTLSIDTPFRVGSITKTFTALTLLRLADAGKISLLDPVKNSLPAGTYRNRWDDHAPLKAIHLLEHTSGLADLSTREFNSNAVLSLTQAMAANPHNREMHWPPGTRHSYSNVNPGLISLLIEQTTGQSFETLALRLLGDLGMPSAGFTQAHVPDLPGGFKADGISALPYWNMSFRAFGALNTSAAEMQEFLFFLLNEGKTRKGVRLLRPATFEQLFTPTSSLAARNGLKIGYAAGLYGWIQNGQILHGHGGDADGYLSRYGLHRESGRGYFIVINTDNPKAIAQLRKRIESALTSDLETRQIAQIDIEETILTQYSGNYYPSTTRFGVQQWLEGQKASARVTVQNGQLVFSYRGRRTRLVPLGNHLFRRINDPIATVAIVIGKDNKLYLQGELGEFVRTSHL